MTVAPRINGEGFQVHFDLPLGGEYGVNIYASSSGESKRVHHVYTYFLKCSEDQPQSKRTSKSLLKSKYMFVEKDHCDIEIKSKKRNFVAQLRKKQSQTKRLDNKHVQIQTDGAGNRTCSCKLPEDGEYNLDVFSVMPTGAVCRVQKNAILKFKEEVSVREY